jgi:FtsZ-interacting cell division protein YlmF
MKKVLESNTNLEETFRLSNFMKALLDIYDAAEAARKIKAYAWIKDVKFKVVRAIVSVVSGDTILGSDNWANLVNILQLFKERFKSAKFAVWQINEGRAELAKFQYGGVLSKSVESYKQLFSKDTVHMWLRDNHYAFAVVKEPINFDAFNAYTEENSSVVQLLQQQKEQQQKQPKEQKQQQEQQQKEQQQEQQQKQEHKRKRVVWDSPDKKATHVGGQKKASPESIITDPTFQSENTVTVIMTPSQSQTTDTEDFLTQNTPLHVDSLLDMDSLLDVDSLLVQIRAGKKVNEVLNEQTMSRLLFLTNKELLSIVECIYTFDKKETFVKSRFRSKESCVKEIQKFLI